MKASADEDGYIIPLRMKSTPSFSSAGSSSSTGSSHRLSLTSFSPAYQQQQQQSLTSSDASTPASRRTLRPGGIRQSRLDLHMKLENHYGTVTGANFQALAQLLEQVRCKRALARVVPLSSGTLMDCLFDLIGDEQAAAGGPLSRVAPDQGPQLERVREQHGARHRAAPHEHRHSAKEHLAVARPTSLCLSSLVAGQCGQ